MANIQHEGSEPICESVEHGECCHQPADGWCKLCGARLCYDHLCSHDRRKQDYGPKWPMEAGK